MASGKDPKNVPNKSEMVVVLMACMAEYEPTELPITSSNKEEIAKNFAENYPHIVEMLGPAILDVSWFLIKLQAWFKENSPRKLPSKKISEQTADDSDASTSSSQQPSTNSSESPLCPTERSLLTSLILDQHEKGSEQSYTCHGDEQSSSTFSEHPHLVITPPSSDELSDSTSPKSSDDLLEQLQIPFSTKYEMSSAPHSSESEQMSRSLDQPLSLPYIPTPESFSSMEKRPRCESSSPGSSIVLCEDSPPPECVSIACPIVSHLSLTRCVVSTEEPSSLASTMQKLCFEDAKLSLDDFEQTPSENSSSSRSSQPPKDENEPLDTVREIIMDEATGCVTYRVVKKPISNVEPEAVPPAEDIPEFGACCQPGKDFIQGQDISPKRCPGCKLPLGESMRAPELGEFCSTFCRDMIGY